MLSLLMSLSQPGNFETICCLNPALYTPSTPCHARICNAMYSCRQTTVDRDSFLPATSVRLILPDWVATFSQPRKGTMQATSLDISDDNRGTKVDGVLLDKA